ncbi:MAG: radical SAM protein [Parcubacteria group bacterium]
MLLPITKKCNQKCLFCSVGNWSDLVKLPNSRDFLKWIIYQTKDKLVISGGEPTLSPNFFWAIRYARQGQIPVEVQTNALTFSEKSFADRVIEEGVDSFSVNFPSHIPRTNDQITRTGGSFKKRMKGLENLEKHNANIRLTHVVCSLNYKNLDEMIEFVKNNFSEKILIQFSFVKIMGFAKKNKQILLTYNEVLPYFLAALSKCEELGINFIVDHMPICNFKDYKEHHVDYEAISSGEKLTYALYEREKIDDCFGCDLSSYCCGIEKDYLKYFGKRNVTNLAK